MILTSAQLARIDQLGDHWSFLWDKRRSLWIAAEDCPDGEQIEEADLDVLLAQLAVVDTECLGASAMVRPRRRLVRAVAKQALAVLLPDHDVARNMSRS